MYGRDTCIGSDSCLINFEFDFDHLSSHARMMNMFLSTLSFVMVGTFERSDDVLARRVLGLLRNCDDVSELRYYSGNMQVQACKRRYVICYDNRAWA